jgi:serine/threonine protein kinase
VNAGQLPELFARAVELDPAGRKRLLAEIATEDEALARQLERMLEADGGSSPLDSPPRMAAEQDARQKLAAGWKGPTPERIGPYRILRALGEGGMGQVFLAEEEAEDYRRRVALKIIPGPRLDEVAVRRFRDEVRILASLEHPGIARFFDGGRAPDGTWFLALEYVEGEDLLLYANRHALGVRARVELILQVLDAVDLAHRRLVVHRDLKPANVLVTAEGRAKLLDFGISKILDPEQSDATRTELRALTPAYASPEQLRGEHVTTATDVYSLGVMLYEALAGRRPFARREVAGAGLVEASRALVERDPEPPSTAAREIATSSLQAEGTPSVRWGDLSGDLDAITLKALRAEPESRYPSVAALAEDLRRWLAGRPVEARRGGRRYRLAKFVRRHRLPVGFAAVALLALAAGVAGIAVQSRRAARAAIAAQEERDFALRQLARAEAINELNSFLLTDAAPLGKPFTVGDLLGRAERVIRNERGWSDAIRVEILLAVGRQFERIDEVGHARPLIEEAYALARQGTDAATRASAECALAQSESLADHFDRAESLYAEALAALPEAPQLALRRVWCLLRGSEIARYGEQPKRAVERAETARRLLRESGQGSDLFALRVEMDLAESYRKADDPARADAAFADAFRRLEALGFGETETAGTLLNNWALVENSLGQPLEAERLFRRSIAISSADGGEQNLSPVLLTNLSRTLLDLGRLAEAKSYAERAEAEARRTQNQFALNLALTAQILADVERGDLEPATRRLNELDARWKAAFPPGSYLFGLHASMSGLIAAARGDLGEAKAAQDRAAEILEATPQRTGSLPIVLLRRSALALRQGDAARAAADAALALELRKGASEPARPSCGIGRAQLALGRALAAQGRAADARAALAAALANLEPTLGADHPETRAARELVRAGTAPPPAN